MTTAAGKIQRLLDARDKELAAQAAEMIITLEDPAVDAWVLSGVQAERTHLPDDVWELPAAPLEFRHRRVPRATLLQVIRRMPPDGPAAAKLRDRLPRLYVEGGGRDLDVSWVGDLPWLSELVVSGPYPGAWYDRHRMSNRRRITGLDRLDRLRALDWLVVIGAADLDLAALVALPGVRRLSVYGCTLAARSYDLVAGTLERLDLDSVRGLNRLTPPPALRELHLTALPDLTGLGDLTASTALTDLSIVDCRRLTALPRLPEPPTTEAPTTEAPTPGTPTPEAPATEAPRAGLRRVRLDCAALASIAPLAGRPLENLDLTGCAALASLDGFPETLGADRLSLNGCASITDVSAIAAAGAALRCLDLRGAAGVSDITALGRLPDLRVVALSGTATGPETVPATLLASCTWAHTPRLDLLGRRRRP